MTPTVVVDVASLFLSIGVNYVFIYGCWGWPGFGFIGSPLALVFVAVVQVVSLWSFAHQQTRCIELVHLMCNVAIETWFGWKAKHCLNTCRLRTYLTLTGTFLVYLCLDEWVYNVLAIMTGTSIQLRCILYIVYLFDWQ